MVVAMEAKNVAQDNNESKLTELHIMKAAKLNFENKLFKNLLAEMTQFVDDHLRGTRVKDLDLVVSFTSIKNLLRAHSKMKASLYAEIA